MSTTYTPISKNTTTYSTVTKQDISALGTPIGLLLVLTREVVAVSTTYTPISRNVTTYSTINKN